MMHIHPFGDSAVLVNFEQEVAPATNNKVLALYQALQAKAKWVEYLIPAHCSLTVGFDPLEHTHEEISLRLADVYAHVDLRPELTPRELRIPVCYDGECQLDLDEVCRYKRISKERLIALHTAELYRVYTMGFLPGFGYLGRLNPKLKMPRKAQPRLRVPSRSVAIAGAETAVYPCSSPGGWQVIGRTPIDMVLDHPEHAFILGTGHLVSFYRIDLAEYASIREEVERNAFNPESLYVE